MAHPDILVGLEIGTSKVCAVVAEVRENDDLKILGVGDVPSRGVRKGEIVDFETAKTCVRDALDEIDKRCGVHVEEVFLSVSGSHIESFNNRGSVKIPDDEIITEEDKEAVRDTATNVNIPLENIPLHVLLQRYYVDGREGILDPLGMHGLLLEADYHLIHGVRPRINNGISCVGELDVVVEDVVFAAYASAEALLSQEKKCQGALVVDMGAGTTDFIVYNEGAVMQSGSLAVGGDHITNDVSIGLRLPMAEAEQLKLKHGSVTIGNSLPGEMITLPGKPGFAGKEVERETLYTIMHLRVREVLEIIRKRLESERYINSLGAGIYLTGGCSLINGMKHLAEDVFELPVHVNASQPATGLVSVLENPRYATAIGCIRYGLVALAENQPPSLLGEIGSKLKGLFGKFGGGK